MSCGNQSNDLHCEPIDKFPYERAICIRPERVKFRWDLLILKWLVAYMFAW